MHQHAAGDTCDDARCKQQKLRQGLKVQSRQAAAVAEKLTKLRDRAAPMAGVDHQPAPIAALPSNDRELAELPDSRRELFREYLEDSICKAMEASDGNASSQFVSVARSDPGLTEAEQAVMGNGCGICRGKCCEAGGIHAFLNPAEIRKKLEREPGVEPTDLVAFYIDKLPAISFVDSCVFHASAGCALDRDDRSEMCNNYYCSGLSQLWHGLTNSGSLRGFVGAMAEERVMRFALIDENGAVDFANY